MAAASSTMITPEFVTAYREMILSTLASEMRTTKKIIAAIPEGRRDYKPDPKSRSAYELAWHIVYEDVGFLNKIADLKIALSPPQPAPASIAEIVKWYGENFPKAVKRVRDMTAEQLTTPVDFFGFMKAPVFQYLILVNNHSIHHRGQLASYLRPMGSRVPGIYGPSGDEGVKM